MARLLRIRTPAKAPPVNRRRSVMGVLAVLIVLISLGIATMILGQRAITRATGHTRSQALTSQTCQYHLRLIYLAQRHLLPGTSELPLEKAVAYAVSYGAGWLAPPEEVAYLEQTHPRSSAPLLTDGDSEVIYCFADPAHEEKVRSVGNMTTRTSSDQIAPSSYVWFPQEEPEILVACPYHHIGVRRNDGEIVPWKADVR